jgi:IS605 OrfB family transposase
MIDKVLEKDDLLEKTNWQRKTYPLKLNLTDFQKVRIENLVYEYKKCINKSIQIVLNELFLRMRILCEDEWKEGICPLCQSKRKLNTELTDFEFVKYREMKGKDIYKPVYNKGNKVNICQSCSTSHYSFRKFLLPSPNRDIPIKEWDFTLSGKLSPDTFKIGVGKRPSIYDSCLQKASETIKSDFMIKKKLDDRNKFLRNRIIENTINLNKEKNNKNKDESLIRKLGFFIRNDEKEIIKNEEKKSEDIKYKADSIRLYENSYEILKNEGDFFIKFLDYSRNESMMISFYGDKYQKKLAEQFINSKNAETEIIRKGNDFYLHYIYRQEDKVPIPDETFIAVGIDIGILNLACRSSLTKDDKISNVVFYNGRRMRNKRQRMSDLRRIWGKKTKQKRYGGKGRTKKWFNEKCGCGKEETKNNKLSNELLKYNREHKYVKYTIHYLTTKIVQDIKDTIEKPVIVLENLKDIRTREDRELKIALNTLNGMNKKSKRYIRTYRKLTADFNKWNFDDFQKFIEYKANWLGIPVVYVPSKDTTIKCNKCGYVGEFIYEKKNIDGKNTKILKENENINDLHELKFECKHCGYKCNSDFNASINIGRLFFGNLNRTPTKDL